MTAHHRPYGVGLAYRNYVHDKFLRYADEIDLLEIPTEDYLVRQRWVSGDPGWKRLREAVNRFPSLLHGISLSIGSVAPLDQKLLADTRALLAETGLTYFSEHLAFQRMDEIDLTIFMCMPFDDLSVDWLARNYAATRTALGRNFALENVSYYFPVPGGKYDEPEFLCRVLERTDCSLLLDVTNIYNNCTNHHQDPVQYIRRLPPERIHQLHLAGGHFENGFLMDSHSYPVMDEVWPFFEEALKHTQADIVIVERDYNVTRFTDLMADVCKAREIFYRHRPRTPPDRVLERPLPPAPAPEPAAEPCAERFADLRNFQRALIREITDDHFRLQVRMDSPSVRRQYPMSDHWFENWQARPAERIDYLATVWRETQESDRRHLEDYRRWEWQQWARVEGAAP